MLTMTSCYHVLANSNLGNEGKQPKVKVKLDTTQKYQRQLITRYISHCVMIKNATTSQEM